MNEIPEPNTLIRLLAGAFMAVLAWFARVQVKRITRLEREYATKTALEQLALQNKEQLNRIEAAVTRTNERMDDLLLLDRGKDK